MGKKDKRAQNLHRRGRAKEKEKEKEKEADVSQDLLDLSEDERTMSHLDGEIDDDLADQLLFDMLTSINFVIIMTVITVSFIVCSMFITMTLLGLSDGTGRRKHIFGFAN